jgi:protein-disulfide isomerase
MTDQPRDDRADERLSLLPLRAHRYLLFVIALVMTGLDISRLTGLWPCDIACQGGAHYQTLFGISVIWFALSAHVLLTGLTWHDIRLGRSTLWTVQLVHLLTGVACFFLVVAHGLGLSCTYCQVVHGLTIVAFLLVIPFTTRRVSLWLPIFGWLLMNAVFHHTPVADVMTTTPAPSTTPTTTPVPPPSAFTQHIEQGRSYGDSAAPYTLEIMIELTCRHCAEQYRPMMEALKPAIANKRVRVVIRHLVRPSQAASKPAAELVLAAAGLGDHAMAMEVLLGSHPEAGASGLQARLADVLDAAKLADAMAKEHDAIAQVLGEDQQRITVLGMGTRTPAAILTSNGRVTQRWSGTLPASAIIAALDDAL